MEYNQTFLAFLDEAQFTKEILGLGVTQLYEANFATKGIYYQSFTCLSTGFERIAKLCLILDYYMNNQGKLPLENDIRKYGHKLHSLFTACTAIVERRQIKLHFPCDLDDSIHQAIINILDDFADSRGRYSNINLLLGKKPEESDPIAKWYNSVDLPLYEKHISNKKKAKIEDNAYIIGRTLDQFAITHFIGEDSANLTSAIETSRRTGMWKAVAPYRQLYVLQFVRFFAQIIVELGYEAMAISNLDIPFFSEIFGCFYNSDAYFRSRKTWNKL